MEGDQLIKKGLDTGWVSFGDQGWTDYDLTFEVRKNAGPGGLGAHFRVHSMNELKFYVLVLGIQGKHSLHLWSRSGDREIRSKPGTLQTLDWYRVKISLRGTRIHIELDDHLLFALTDTFSQEGWVDLELRLRRSFRNIKVTAPDGTLLWEGPPDLTGKPAGGTGGSSTKTASTPAQPPGNPPVPPAAVRPVISRFARNDAEGWYTLNQDESRNATRSFGVDTLGDNAWLLATDQPNGKEWGWHAPPKFHGDRSTSSTAFSGTTSTRPVPRLTRLAGTFASSAGEESCSSMGQRSHRRSRCNGKPTASGSTRRAVERSSGRVGGSPRPRTKR